MGDLGTPDSYTVQIHRSDAAYEYNPNPVVSTSQFSNVANPVLRQVEFSNIKWQRVRNDISSASVVVPRSSLAAGESFFYPRAWRHKLVIFRNGYRVWSGPIMGWSRSGDGDLEIRARDGAMALQRQYVTVSRNYVDEEVSQVVGSVLHDADISTPGNTPYPITVGLTYPLGFYARSASPGQPIDAYVTRTLDVKRYEHVWDVLRDFMGANKMFATCVNDYLYLNEIGVRQQLAVGDEGWPILTDDNVIGIPTVVMDGLNLTTSTIRTSQPEEFQQYQGVEQVIDTITNLGGPDGYSTFFPLAAFDIAEGRQQSGAHGWQWSTADTRPIIYREGTPSGYAGEQLLRSHVVDDTPQTDLSGDPYFTKATFAAFGAPTLTLEQVRLAPSFSHPSLADDLSNLLPGTRFKIGFADRSAFDVPISENKVSMRHTTMIPSVTGAVPAPGVDLFRDAFPGNYFADPNDWFAGLYYFDMGMTALWASRCDHVTLSQLDVEVTGSDQGMEEVVLGSFTPTIQYVLKEHDGTETIVVNSAGATVPIPARPRFVG